MKFKTVTSVILSIFLLNCASTFNLKKSKIDTLALSLEFDDSAQTNIGVFYENIIDEIISEYNGSLRLLKAGEEKKNVLKIHMGPTRVADSKTRKASIILSAIGLTIPIYLISQKSSFVVGFVYLPMNRTSFKLDLSSNLEDNDKIIRKTASTYSFSGDTQAQLDKQKDVIKKQILAVIKSIDKQNKNF